METKMTTPLRLGKISVLPDVLAKESKGYKIKALKRLGMISS
jgi:hypothetical protein